jgi:hypothetical protein
MSHFIKGAWRKQHNVELHKLHSSPNIIRMMKTKGRRREWERNTHGNEEECIEGFDGKARKNKTTRKT